jgi:cellulose biosynthesis protein BcsQ
LQSEGLLQILAEPNLVTTTGKEASFLVGGEFPCPDLAGWRQCGRCHDSVPGIWDQAHIQSSGNGKRDHQDVRKTEVSTIDLSNAVTVSGFLIPALATRRMETNVELGPGQSFVIGGLIDDRVQESMSKVPGLASIPLLGAIFKSRDERKNRTELIVLVTPEVTRPSEAGEPAPIPVMPREFMAPVVPLEKGSTEPTREKTGKRARTLNQKRKPRRDSCPGRARMRNRGPHIRALMVSPNRRIADDFLASLGRGSGFDIVGDLRAYPAIANLDTRIRQLRPDVLLLRRRHGFEYGWGTHPSRHHIAKPGARHRFAHRQRFRSNPEVTAERRVGVSFCSFRHHDPGGGPRSNPEPAAIVGIGTRGRQGGGFLERESRGAALRHCDADCVRSAPLERQTVLLVDFDLTTGSLAFYMNVQHSHSLLDLVHNPDRVADSDVWSRATVDAHGIDFIPAPELPYTDAVEPGALHRVLEQARNLYEWIVIDLPSVFHRLSLLTLAESDRAFVVSTAELASLHLTRNAIRLVSQLGLDSEKMQVLVNRMEKRTDLNLSDLSKLFECKVIRSCLRIRWPYSAASRAERPLTGDTSSVRLLTL